jgi:hypothetical protein
MTIYSRLLGILQHPKANETCRMKQMNIARTHTDAADYTLATYAHIAQHKIIVEMIDVPLQAIIRTSRSMSEAPASRSTATLKRIQWSVSPI